MPAKKAASKKRKRAGASKARTATRRPGVSRKSSGKKRKVSKSKRKSAAKKSRTKKSATKKVARKKAAARRKAPARKTAKKKAAKKPRGKKVAKKSAARKGTSKKVRKTAAKGAAGKKKAAPKKAAKKKSSKKQTGRKAAASRVPRSRQDVLSGPIHGIEPYAMKRGEDYMSPDQLEHFRAILTSWKRELMNEVDRTVHHMQDEAANFPDPNDRATQESEFGLELRTRDRERKLLRKIDSALARIDEGTYGYCDETGEEIGLKRLEARPVATLSLEAQERREMAERQFRDRDDRYR